MQEAWHYNEAIGFQKSLERLKLNKQSDFLVFLKLWATGFNNKVQNTRTTRCFQNQIFEIWVAGLPNPEANKGKSGGFRLTFFIHLTERKIYMCDIDHRHNKGFKGEKPKKKQEDAQFLNDLKGQLLNELTI